MKMGGTRKGRSEEGDLEQERQIWYIFTYMWILTAKDMIAKLYNQVCGTTEIRYMVRDLGKGLIALIRKGK